MKSFLRLTGAVMLAAAGLAIGAAHATAQPIAWNPPCTVANVSNLTACNIVLNINTAPAGGIKSLPMGPGAFLGGVPVPPVPGVPPPPIGFTGVTSRGGIAYGIVCCLVPPVGLPPTATDAVLCVDIGTPTVPCCCDVWFDVASCSVFVLPAACPNPPCRP